MTHSVEPEAAALAAYLSAKDPNYSETECMVGQLNGSPGYHTRIPDGVWVHPTRETLDYALALLAAGRDARAIAVVQRILSLQDTDPASRTYGIWSWYMEEPLAAMSPPDWNWADFCGARLLVILHLHGARLPVPLVDALRTAIGHAAAAIVRRDVGPGYTNIALMGGTVTAAAGELLADPTLLAYGRARLQKLVAFTLEHGSFNEYNSPIYTMVALEEAERALHLVRDPDTRTAAEWLRGHAWEVIADHYHPGTAQWAGPHSRTYADRLRTSTRVAFDARLQTPLAQPGAAAPGTAAAKPAPVTPEFLPPIPCAPAIEARLHQRQDTSPTIRRRFIKHADDPTRSIWGTTWFADDACLGSINRGVFWTQCRPLLGYIHTPEDPAVVLRLRVLHDGRDFATAFVQCLQDGPLIHADIGLEDGHGDYHLHLDKPADGVFQVTDLRARLELRGRGVRAEAREPGVFALIAGQWEAHVQVGPAQFQGQPLTWAIADLPDGPGVCLEAVCYAGQPHGFRFPAFADADLALTLRLLRRP